MAEATSSLSQYWVKRLKDEKHCKKENEDIISSLPDEVLCHILSFLPTKYAAGTSILSTRWRYLWNSVANLHFDDTSMFGFGKCWTTLEFRKCFMSFVDRVLLLHSGRSIKKFHLKCKMGYWDSSWMKASISAAIMSNIEELDLCISTEYGSTIQLPQNLFACEKLVVLKVNPQMVHDVPDCINFPNLKVLHLGYIRCLDDVIGRLISGSPVIEEFVFDGNYVRDHGTVHVRSPSLKSLTIHKSTDLYYRYDYFRVAVDAPKLEFLDLTDCFFEESSTIQLSSLVKANIDISSECIHRHFAEGVVMAVQLLSQVSVVKHLCLCDETLFTLYRAATEELLSLDNLRTFHSLTHLEVRDCGDTSLHLFPDILNCMPNLKVLVVKSWWRSAASREPVPRCVES